MKNLLKRFVNDKKGSAYVLAAFAVIPMFGFAALAVDYTNQDRLKTEIETAAETVALHVAKRVALDPNASSESMVTEGKAILESLVKVPVIYDKFSVNMNTGQVQIAIHSDVDTYFMHMFGYPTLQASSQTEARFGRLNVDVAIGIDNSGSMGGTVPKAGGGYITKIDAAKKAAKLLVKTAAASVEDLTNTNLRFSIVPWHSHVSLPDSELRTGAAANAKVDVGTWKDWIDWDGRSSNHFTYLAPYKKDNGGGHGDMYFNMNGDDEWNLYDPEKLLALLPKELDGNGIDLKTLKAKPNIGIVTRKDVFKNTDTVFNGCFEHRAGKYRYSFAKPTISAETDPALDPQFDGDSLYIPNMSPDERDDWSDRNSYVKDTGGDSDHTDGYHYGGSNGDDGSYNDEKPRVMNSAKYVNIKKGTGGQPDHLWAGTYDSPNGSCNTAKVLPLNDDIRGVDPATPNPKGAIATAIDNMGANGFTDQSIGLEWTMNSITPWEPLAQGGEFDETQKIMVFMTDGYNETRNKNDYKQSYMSFQYPRDDVWNAYTNQPSGTNINYQINEATKKMCDAIKARGVRLYFIYFGTPNADATAIKNHCASSPETAIEATDEATLSAAFERIGDDIGRLRLVHYSN